MIYCNNTLYQSEYFQLTLAAQLNPMVVVVLSVAAADKTGLPSPETIQAVEGYNLLRTDQYGWIELTTDGEQIWVEVEKK